MQRWSAELRHSPQLVFVGACVGYLAFRLVHGAMVNSTGTGAPGRAYCAVGEGSRPAAHWRLLGAAGGGAAVPALLGVFQCHPLAALPTPMHDSYKMVKFLFIVL